MNPLRLTLAIIQAPKDNQCITKKFLILIKVGLQKGLEMLTIEDLKHREQLLIQPPKREIKNGYLIKKLNGPIKTGTDQMSTTANKSK